MPVSRILPTRDRLSRKHLHALIALLLAAMTLAAFWPVLSNGFVDYDDGKYVVNNEYVRAGLTVESAAWAFTSTHAANWHPLTWLSHMLDCEVYELKAWGHHLTSLLLHIANVLLLFLVLSRATGFPWRSAFVAALFAIHPLHVESVAWIAERKDVLSTLFWMLTMLAYVRYAEHPNLKRYALMALVFALGLMAKPMLVTLPLVLLLMDYWPLNRLTLRGIGSLKGLLVEKIPLFALSGASCAVTYAAQQKGGAISLPECFPVGVRAANALVAYVGYIWKTISPGKLAVLYLHPRDMLPTWQVMGALLLLVAVSALILRAWRSRPYLLVGWLWYVGTLVPVIGLVQVGIQAMADRYTYVPLIGIFIIAAWGIPDLMTAPSKLETRAIEAPEWKRKKHKMPPEPPASSPPSVVQLQWLAIPAAVVIVALMICSWRQAGCWRNTFTLFQYAITATDDNFVAHTNVGDLLVAQGKVDEGIRHYEKAIEINPNSWQIRRALGSALLKQDKPFEAIEQYSEAVRIEPNSLEARTFLGNALLQQGLVDEAIVHLLEAVRLGPNLWQTHYNLANALNENGSYGEAIVHFSKSLQINPANANAHSNLGLALATQGKFEEAIAHYLKATQINPNLVEAYINLGSALIDQGNAEEAIKYLSQALKIRPDSAKAHANMAAALYLKRDHRQAWEEIRLCRKYGLEPPSHLVKLFSRKMPEPKE